MESSWLTIFPATVRQRHRLQHSTLPREDLDLVPISSFLRTKKLSPHSLVPYRLHRHWRIRIHPHHVLFMLAHQILLEQKHQGRPLRRHAGFLVQPFGLQYHHRLGRLVSPDAGSEEASTSQEAEDQSDCGLCSGWIVRRISRLWAFC